MWGWHLAKHIRKLGMWQYFLYPGGSGGTVGGFIMQFDLFYEIPWKGIVLLSSEVILRHRASYHGLTIPNPGHEATILLLKDLLSQGRVFPKYRTRIPALIEQDHGRFRASLHSLVGQETAKLLLGHAVEGHWEEIEAQRNTVRLRVAGRAFRQSPLSQTARWLMFIGEHVRERVLAPSGLFIVVLGSDGSGKTTVIYELRPLLEKLFTCSRRLAFNFNTLPHVLGDLRDWVQKSRGGSDTSEEKAKQGPRLTPLLALHAWAHLAYHTIGFLLGFPFLFVTRRRGELVIVERYFYEYFVQPLYICIPRWLLRGVLRLVPKPDAVIYLHGDPQLIHVRKPELPVVEIDRQTAIFIDLLAQMPNGLVIDVSAPVSAVARQIAHLICQVMEQKVRL